MGSESFRSRPHYDISMSRRTRKPLVLIENEMNQSSVQESNALKKSDEEVVIDQEAERSCEKGSEQEDKKSLKQLIQSRNSLGEHFTEEEKQLQLIVKQPDNGLNGVKLKHMVSRYAKFLSHMVKIKRGQKVGSRLKSSALKHI